MNIGDRVGESTAERTYQKASAGKLAKVSDCEKVSEGVGLL